MFLSSGSAPVCIIDHLFPKVKQYFLNNSISNKLRFISLEMIIWNTIPKLGYIYDLNISPAAVFDNCLDMYPLPLAIPPSCISDQSILSVFAVKLYFILYIWRSFIFFMDLEMSYPNCRTTAIWHFSQIILNAPIESLVNSLRGMFSEGKVEYYWELYIYGSMTDNG